MTELLTAFATVLPFAFVVAVGVHTPRDSKGTPVRPRGRTFSKDVCSFLGFATY